MGVRFLTLYMHGCMCVVCTGVSVRHVCVCVTASHLHAVQPGVSAGCADAKWRDLTFTAFSLSCTPVTIFLVMTMTDPNQSAADWFPSTV